MEDGQLRETLLLRMILFVIEIRVKLKISHHFYNGHSKMMSNFIPRSNNARYTFKLKKEGQGVPSISFLPLNPHMNFFLSLVPLLFNIMEKLKIYNLNMSIYI